MKGCIGRGEWVHRVHRKMVHRKPDERVQMKRCKEMGAMGANERVHREPERSRVTC